MRTRRLLVSVSVIVAGLLVTACGGMPGGARSTPTIPSTSPAVRLAMADLHDWYVTPEWNATVWTAMYEHRAANPCWKRRWPNVRSYIAAWEKGTKPGAENNSGPGAVAGSLSLLAVKPVKAGEVEVRAKRFDPGYGYDGWLEEVMAFNGKWAVLHWHPAGIDRAGVVTAHGRPSYPYGFNACQGIEIGGATPTPVPTGDSS